MRARILIIFVVAALQHGLLREPRMISGDAGKGPASRCRERTGAPPSVTVIGARDAHGILGAMFAARQRGHGRIVDVIVDREGTVRAASSISAGSRVGAAKSWSTGTRCVSDALPTRATASPRTDQEQVTAAPNTRRIRLSLCSARRRCSPGI